MEAISGFRKKQRQKNRCSMFGSSSSRGEEYQETTESSNLDQLSAKLVLHSPQVYHCLTRPCSWFQASDLRDHVKKLKAHPLYSQEWIGLVESFQYVAGPSLRTFDSHESIYSLTPRNRDRCDGGASATAFGETSRESDPVGGGGAGDSLPDGRR